jgi:hypothetical protein
VLIDAVDAPLHDGKVALYGVGVVIIPDVFLSRVVHDAMVGVKGARGQRTARLFIKMGVEQILEPTQTAMSARRRA